MNTIKYFYPIGRVATLKAMPAEFTFTIDYKEFCAAFRCIDVFAPTTLLLLEGNVLFLQQASGDIRTGARLRSITSTLPPDESIFLAMKTLALSSLVAGHLEPTSIQFCLPTDVERSALKLNAGTFLRIEAGKTTAFTKVGLLADADPLPDPSGGQDVDPTTLVEAITKVLPFTQTKSRDNGGKPSVIQLSTASLEVFERPWLHHVADDRINIRLQIDAITAETLLRPLKQFGPCKFSSDAERFYFSNGQAFFSGLVDGSHLRNFAAVLGAVPAGTITLPAGEFARIVAEVKRQATFSGPIDFLVKPDGNVGLYCRCPDGEAETSSQSAGTIDGGHMPTPICNVLQRFSAKELWRYAKAAWPQTIVAAPLDRAIKFSQKTEHSRHDAVLMEV